MAEQTISIRSSEKGLNLLLNLTAIAGRRFQYRVVPAVFYLRPNEEIVVNGESKSKSLLFTNVFGKKSQKFLVTRGRILNGSSEWEWRDVLGIEAIQSILPPKPHDPEHPLSAKESKELVDYCFPHLLITLISLLFVLF